MIFEQSDGDGCEIPRVDFVDICSCLDKQIDHFVEAVGCSVVERCVSGAVGFFVKSPLLEQQIGDFQVSVLDSMDEGRFANSYFGFGEIMKRRRMR